MWSGGRDPPLAGGRRLGVDVGYLLENARQVSWFFRVLSDPSRLTILLYLLKVERACVNELSEATGYSPSLVSYHLSNIKLCGLVESVREGRRTYYRVVDREGLARLLEAAGSLASSMCRLE